MIPLGSLVYLRGGRLMLVVDTNEKFAVCAWKVDGQVVERIFPNSALKIETLPAA